MPVSLSQRVLELAPAVTFDLYPAAIVLSSCDDSPRRRVGRLCISGDVIAEGFEHDRSRVVRDYDAMSAEKGRHDGRERSAGTEFQGIEPRDFEV
jgi:hypothetical protein